jgi:hypothetical protein
VANCLRLHILNLFLYVANFEFKPRDQRGHTKSHFSFHIPIVKTEFNSKMDNLCRANIRSYFFFPKFAKYGMYGQNVLVNP